MQTDFYKLQRLTPQDLALLKMLFGQGRPSAVRTHGSLVAMLIAPFELAEPFRGSPNWPKIEAQLDEHASNVLEDYHASIESSFAPALERALAGDLGFYTDDAEFITFLNFLCTQYMRTRGIKERTLELSPFLERVWNVMIHITATNIGSSLYVERRRRKLVIVENRSEVPFVTGDQPAINLKGARPVPTDQAVDLLSHRADRGAADGGRRRGSALPATGLTRAGDGTQPDGRARRAQAGVRAVRSVSRQVCRGRLGLRPRNRSPFLPCRDDRSLTAIKSPPRQADDLRPVSRRHDKCRVGDPPVLDGRGQGCRNRPAAQFHARVTPAI
ncbi:hypothetical protein ACVIYL_008663 [Bradyrhizobium sp. USDA 3315]